VLGPCSAGSPLLCTGEFSVAEMRSSPKEMKDPATLARSGQGGWSMGYANIPVAVGWMAGGGVAGDAHEEGGDKPNLARRHLVREIGWAGEREGFIDRAEEAAQLRAEPGSSAAAAQALLCSHDLAQTLWIEIGGIGLRPIVGMVVYDRVIRRLDGKTAKS
jgi:hypothetical protein